MAESSRGAAMALVSLLVLEGLAGLLVTILNVVTSRALGQDFLPWESSVIPAGFGVLCLLAAFGLMRFGSWGTILATISQLLVLAAGVFAILDKVRPLAWAVIVIGILGLLLVSRTGRRV